MKKILIFIAIASAFLAFGSFYFFRTSPDIGTPVQLTHTPTETPTLAENTPFVSDDGKTISYGIIRTTASHMQLLSNLPDATDSASVMSLHQCEALTNAGFYTKEQTHLGLFETNERVVTPKIQSALLDGFVFKTVRGRIQISHDIDAAPHTFALQSGPMIWVNGAPRLLSIHSDEYARRLVIARDDTEGVFFIVLYDADSVFAGPKLARVPYILEKINTTERLNLATAINLDGGTASVFLTAAVHFSELLPAGGFFCIRR